jgi:diacylglycerol kinase (ATP)
VAGALVLISVGASRVGDTDARDRLRSTIEAGLAKRGSGDVEVRHVSSPAESEAALAAAIAAGTGTVVVVGGDGTVRTAVAALADTQVELGIVPVGTGNLFAAALELPREAQAAALALATARVRKVDSAGVEIAGRRDGYAVSAGVGFDARVMDDTPSRDKARFGIGAYFMTAIRLLSSLPVARTTAIVDGKRYEFDAVATMVLNCGQIIPGKVGPRAPVLLDDGLLDLVAIRGAGSVGGLFKAGGSGLSALFSGAQSTAGSIRLRGQEISVATDPPEPMQLDGDLIEGAGGSFRAWIRPGSLRVLVPFGQ